MHSFRGEFSVHLLPFAVYPGVADSVDTAVSVERTEVHAMVLVLGSLNDYIGLGLADELAALKSDINNDPGVN